MKRIITSLALIATVLSCTQKEPVENVKVQPDDTNLVPVTFTAKADMTKAALVNEVDVVFSAGDKIAVFKNGNRYEFVTEAGGANAVFTGSIASIDLSADGDFYALYPYSEATIDNGTITGVTLSKYSTATAGSFYSKQAIFVAKSSTSELVFKSAVALLKLTVPEEVTDLKEIAIFNRQSSDLGGSITGIFNVTPGDGSPVVEVTAAHSTTEPHTAGLNASGVINPGTYYIPVLPSTLTSGFDMKLSFSDFNGRAAIGKSLTFEAGKIYSLGTIKRDRFFVYSGFESETINVKSTTWTGNDVFVRSNPFVGSGNTSSKVLEMDMRTRSESSATSGYLDHTLTISSSAFKQFFTAISVKVYFGEDKYYPHFQWNKTGSEYKPAMIDGVPVSSKDEFDAAMTPNTWHTLTWTASQFEKSNLSSLTSMKIRYFVDWNKNSLKRADGYQLYACIDDVTFIL